MMCLLVFCWLRAAAVVVAASAAVNVVMLTLLPLLLLCGTTAVVLFAVVVYRACRTWHCIVHSAYCCRTYLSLQLRLLYYTAVLVLRWCYRNA